MHFLPAKKKIQYCGLNLKQIKDKMTQNLTSKHRVVKNLQTLKTFSKNVNEKGRQFFKK